MEEWSVGSMAVGYMAASTQGGSSAGDALHCVPKGSHCGESRGGSPGLLSSLDAGLKGCPKCHLVTPSVPQAPGGTDMGWLCIAPHLNLQWAAVTTQFSLIKEPPQKWDPKRFWGGTEEELGLGRLSPLLK